MGTLLFGVTASSIIVRGDKPLAAFLGLDLSYWQEKAKAEEEREAYLTAFKEKTEAFESYFSEVILNLSKMLT